MLCKYTRRVKPQNSPVRASKDGVLHLSNPIGRAVIQLNLEVPSNWTQDDVQALISLVTQNKKDWVFKHFSMLNNRRFFNMLLKCIKKFE